MKIPETLSTYVELISDDFQSTFTVVDENTLVNMMGFPEDFMKLTKIIQNYMGPVEVWFMKSGKFNEPYDMYCVRADEIVGE